ncbi:hypothetical protein A2881_03100 [Candidatus Peribacteria bacterium RIFCSPHIGHO2_01_FULL_55_13]|nr:MAG: hypothetical protein A2881_03100 [Candidatus Peribacteria bacterium RIFCSPHIGHO2_01_FULL_55_13]OGJ64687.1 MAG: hypothetical protein A3F36_01620 [Candidatus Peribacteria bacterium RIFCSPHIGHO2_12_FULL_55_11]
MSDSPYNDDDLVYADPEKRIIVGKVEFGKNGSAKPLQMPEVIRPPKEGDERRRGKPRKRFYPWGTYKTMRKLYKIDGGVVEADRQITLDLAMEKSAKEPFWN